MTPLLDGRRLAESALHLKPTPRPSVTIIAGGEWYVSWAGTSFTAMLESAEAVAGVYQHAFDALEPDLMWTGAGLLNYPAHILGCPLEERGAVTPALTGPAVAGLREVDGLTIDTVTESPLMRTIIEGQYLLADRIGRDCLLLPTGWGPFTLASRLVGTEAAMLAVIADPEGLTRVMDFCTEVIWALAERFLTHPDIAGINISEPTASCDLISPDTFRNMVAPQLSRLIDRVKQTGKVVTMHICGDTTRLLDQVAKLAPHGFSLEHKVSLERAKEVLGGRVCVLGNLSPTGVMLRGTPDDIRQQGRACLETWGPDPGYILTMGCDFPKETPYENLQALMSLKES